MLLFNNQVNANTPVSSVVPILRKDQLDSEWKVKQLKWKNATNKYHRSFHLLFNKESFQATHGKNIQKSLEGDRKYSSSIASI